MVLMTALARSKAWICGRSLAEIAGSNSAGGMGSVFCEFCVLSARGLCDGPSRVNMCVCCVVCVVCVLCGVFVWCMCVV
jgi:hypothetical protein